MPAPILHLGATMTCLHAGLATPLTPFPRVLVSGQPIVTQSTPYAITGCALAGTSNPPCITAQWVVGAVRVLAGGVPVVLQTSTAVCVPTGTGLLPLVVQPRVMAT
ncbi:conserved hypothetical protein [Nitrosomonas nitrosa]|jgi:hypothetical protein|uniref:DUF4280 domain-containing protein n=1 Tax=Nitrosomonas nitrosa TaxID=52442 RepID=A0A1I4M290_9PROT|nr:hypothetical protein [Nitrosomonas nitrosa]MCO6434107.1 hypothetical protein [Nitrosomonas nitrosa]CAE6484210.1 conserved hypothetical protein [Nitrosomonas nitrosa]SFL97087.1 hypothetical protein SAMN05421880_10373 [Nitrosomonas nitrosa]